MVYYSSKKVTYLCQLHLSMRHRWNLRQKPILLPRPQPLGPLLLHPLDSQKPGYSFISGILSLPLGSLLERCCLHLIPTRLLMWKPREVKPLSLPANDQPKHANSKLVGRVVRRMIEALTIRHYTTVKRCYFSGYMRMSSVKVHGSLFK